MKLFFVPFIFVTLTGCMTPLILEPKSGPGTPYPCGPTGVSCAGHKCCTENHVCGGTPFSACPPGACCFTGDGMHIDVDGGVPMTPERPE